MKVIVVMALGGYLLRLVALSARSGGHKNDCFWFRFDLPTISFSNGPGYRISSSSETKISVVRHLDMVGSSGEIEAVVGSSEQRESFFVEENTGIYLVVNNTLFLLGYCHLCCEGGSCICLRAC